MQCSVYIRHKKIKTVINKEFYLKKILDSFLNITSYIIEYAKNNFHLDSFIIKPKNGNIQPIISCSKLEKSSCK